MRPPVLILQPIEGQGYVVIPAKAGIHKFSGGVTRNGIPAFAGMTGSALGRQDLIESSPNLTA